jgi:hypothetical protein
MIEMHLFKPAPSTRRVIRLQRIYNF